MFIHVTVNPKTYPIVGHRILGRLFRALEVGVADANDAFAARRNGHLPDAVDGHRVFCLDGDQVGRLQLVAGNVRVDLVGLELS